MALDTGIMPAGALNINTTKDINKKTSKTIINDNKAFRPDTNVSIRGAIKDLQGILSKIISQQASDLKTLSPEIRALINKILENAFSLPKTLQAGLGATLQNRRYSLEELKLLANVFKELGNLADKGQDVNLSHTMRQFLQEFENNTSNKEALPNNVELVKTAFSLLNGKDIDDFPTLRSLILTNEKRTDLQNFLENILSDDLPQIVQEGQANKTAPSHTENASDNVITQKLQSPNTDIDENIPTNAIPAKNSPNQTVSSSHIPSLQTKDAPLNKDVNMAQTTPLPSTSGEQEMPAMTKGGFPSSTVLSSNNTVLQEDMSAKTLRANTTSAPPNPPSFTELEPTVQQLPIKNAVNNTPTAQQIFRQLLENVQAELKNAPASNILTRPEINLSTRALEQDLQSLENLARTLEHNIPSIILQATEKHHLNNLPKLWVLNQLKELAHIPLEHNAMLHKAGEDIDSFAKFMNKSFPAESFATANGKSLDFLFPLFLDKKTNYPTYLNIYNEEDNAQTATGKRPKSTWMRLCCLTNNIGVVEIIMHLYDRENLSINLSFSRSDIAIAFENYAQGFRQYVQEYSPFRLTDLHISSEK